MIAMNNVKPMKLGQIQDHLVRTSRTLNRIHSGKTINQMSEDTIKEGETMREENLVLGDGGLQSKSSLFNKAQNMLRNSKNSIESIAHKVTHQNNFEEGTISKRKEHLVEK